MRHIKSILFKKTVDNFVQKADENMICEKVKEIIKQKSTDDFEVLFYKNKTIYIKCYNSSLANELNLLQQEIKEEINKFFNKNVLNGLIIKTG